MSDPRIVFGPVPSRRLGRSLGINNIPPKTCSYGCVYCQVGTTLRLIAQREEFYLCNDLVTAVTSAVADLRKTGDRVDYLTFVSDGEPTLDTNLGREIAALKPLEIPIAVISNTSLIRRQDVRRELAAADWVSLKFDTVDPVVWRRLNRPHRSLDLSRIMEGARKFVGEFPGVLTTETMLVRGINDDVAELEALATFLGELSPRVAYLSVPTRPPARESVRAPEEDSIAAAFRIFSRRLGTVEYLIGYEGNAFSATGDVERDLLSITSVHPMREEAVGALLSKNGAEWSVVQELMRSGKLVSTDYDGQRFYLRSPAFRQ